ncbi:hypothetical protein ACFL1R_12655 [Candidatus Latescibacterota bacterium]
MKNIVQTVTLTIFAISLSIFPAPAQTKNTAALTVSGQWFISCQTGKTGDKYASNFSVKRGYINIKKRLTDRISGRITPDISVDREGDGEGDLEMRLKYCYMDIVLDTMSFMVKPHVEFGLVHPPWIDFEQSINLYRMQDPMFLDRNKILNSADFGITFFSLLGGEMDDDYQKNVSSKNPGKYGSVAAGIYNGGGYHAIERNNNKTIEARMTLRPVPSFIPGLQVSYHGITGKGNTAKNPDWTLNACFVSLENLRYVITGMYFSGVGNFKGSAVNGSGDAMDQSGYSLFGELKIFKRKFRLIGRYDMFDDKPDTDDNNLKRIIAGIAYHIHGKTKALLDYDISTRNSWSGYEEARTQFTIEYNF